MIFKDLTDKDIDNISKIYLSTELDWGEKLSKLMKLTGKKVRTVGYWVEKLGLTKKGSEFRENSEQFDKAKKKTHKKRKKYFLITWAQNNTNIHKEMLKNMEAYSKFLDGDILVIAGRYKNPTSLRSSDTLKHKEKSNEITWDSEIIPYLTANRHNLHKYLMILADVKMQPTAHNPLTGFEGFSGLESSILGHPKQHLQSLPILDGYPHKILTSTGAITEPNYTDTKAGKKGEFNHIYGFIIVEIRDKEVFHIRNVNVDDSGEFNDLFFNINNGEVTNNNSIEAIIWGDLHFGSEDSDILLKTFKLTNILKPKYTVLHDVFDGRSISHHHEKDPFIKFKKSQTGEDNLEAELEYLLDKLELFKEGEGQVIISRSNHDCHVDQYLRERDWKRDTVNSLIYMKLATLILDGSAEEGIIPFIINEVYPEYKCLGTNDSYQIKGIECSLHGDRGSNGARGGSTSFRKLNVKTVTGHTHTPEIKDGSFIVGTSTYLRLEYNTGLSSWMNAHTIIDGLGKRQLILFAHGEFTTLIEKWDELGRIEHGVYR